MILEQIKGPEELKSLSAHELTILAEDAPFWWRRSAVPEAIWLPI